MNGGAIQNNSASEFGGGIYNLGDMQLDGVNIRDNTAPEAEERTGL
jgi:predicted outer membrane repeat protein